MMDDIIVFELEKQLSLLRLTLLWMAVGLNLPIKQTLTLCWINAAVNVGPTHRGLIRHLGGGPRVVVSTAAFHARVRGSVPSLGGLKETKMFHPRVTVSIVGSLRDREVACSASDRQGSNFESCVWRTVSSQSSHHPQEVLLARFISFNSSFEHRNVCERSLVQWLKPGNQRPLVRTLL